MENLYRKECQDFITKLREIVQINRERLINAAQNKDPFAFVEAFNFILEEINSKCSDFSWGGCSPGRYEISQEQLSENCWSLIFELCLSASKITDFRRGIRNLFSYVSGIVNKCSRCRNTFTSWLLFLSNPELFMPLCQDSMPATIGSLADLIMIRLQRVEGVRDYRSSSQKCTGARSDNVGCFLELFVILNYFRLKKGYPDMIPLICYFFKRRRYERDIQPPAPPPPPPPPPKKMEKI